MLTLGRAAHGHGRLRLGAACGRHVRYPGRLGRGLTFTQMRSVFEAAGLQAQINFIFRRGFSLFLISSIRRAKNHRENAVQKLGFSFQT